MKQIETLLIIHQHSKILLGLKNPRKKFGGKWNGWGGKVEKNESIENCIIREISEEAGIQINKPKKIGEILFKFEIQEPDHEVHIFVTDNYKGNLTYSEDFIEYKWFKFQELPENMMPADKKWLPFLFQNKKFKGEVYFDREMQFPKADIYEVEKLN